MRNRAKYFLKTSTVLSTVKILLELEVIRGVPEKNTHSKINGKRKKINKFTVFWGKDLEHDQHETKITVHSTILNHGMILSYAYQKENRERVFENTLYFCFCVSIS